MHRTSLFFILFLFLTASAMAQEPNRLDFLEDLTYFKTTLPQKHINLFSKVSKKDFNAKIDAIAQKVDSLNYETFIAELLKLIVAIGDEHTFVQVNYDKVLPIKFEWFKEGIYVTGIDSQYANAISGKLTAINGISMTEVSKRFKAVILSENKSYFEVRFLSYLNNPSFLKGLKLTNSENEVTYTLATADGKEMNITLQSVLKPENNHMSLSNAYASLLATKNTDFYWYQFDEKSRVLYFNYSTCREMPQKPFAKFNDELFALIAREKPTKIVLDLRNNSGGNSAILGPFIDKIQQLYLNDRQKFFVLIGKRTFSSALMNAVTLKKNLSVTLVGEPTSGSINHYGEVRGFDLPKTKLTIGYSTKYWETWKGKKGPLKPDVAITYSVNQFMNGNDEALDYIFKRK